MNQKTIDKVSQVFYDTNFATKFAWPMFFNAQAYMFQLKTDGFVKWLNGLQLPLVDNVWINTVDTKQDKEIIYGPDDYKQFGYGELASRSLAIPAFIDKPPYIDGGVAQNPCITQWDSSVLPIFVSQLMMPFRRTPTGRFEKLFYSWEFSSFQKFQIIKEKYGDRIKSFYPMINDIDSTNFGLSKNLKQDMVKKGYQETIQQLQFYGMKRQENPVDILLALSGGGIRSGAHIGVVQALMEYNYNPVQWSGTSGGAAFAIMFSGFEKMLGNV